MVAGELGLSLDEGIAFEKRHGRTFQIIFKPGLVYEHIDFNLDNPILADRRVRQALLYALDRETIVSQVFAGWQPVADTNVSPLDRMYSGEVRRYRGDRLDAPARYRQPPRARRRRVGRRPLS